jgi:hypothetical protein
MNNTFMADFSPASLHSVELPALPSLSQGKHSVLFFLISHHKPKSCSRETREQLPGFT